MRSDPELVSLVRKLQKFARGPADLRECYEAALKLAEHPGAEEEIWRLEAEDLPGWLLALPHELSAEGLVDEAVHLGRTLSEVLEPENFLADCAVILAEAGRTREAVKHVEENILDEPLAIARMGDAMRSAGELPRAQALYRQAAALEDDPWSRHDILEREIPLLRKMGRKEEARALEFILERLRRTPYDEEDSVDDDVIPWEDETPPLPKVGRNARCPCGSGKKFKKCCGK